MALEVYRHRCGGIPQHPLHHLRVGSRAQPERRRRVAQVVDAQLGTADRHFGSRQPTERCQFVSRRVNRPGFCGGLNPREDADRASIEEVSAGVAGPGDAACRGARKEDAELSLNQAVIRVGTRSGGRAAAVSGLTRAALP